jgi:Flp pilus assembly CpaE family ATPase
VQELGTVPSPQPVVVVNRVRASAVGPRPEERIADSLLRFAGIEAVRFVPDEPAVTDAALLAGRSVVEQAPDSALRQAVSDLATALVPSTRSRASRRPGGWRGWGGRGGRRGSSRPPVASA